MNILVMTSTTDSFHALRPEAQIYLSLAKQNYNITIMTQKNSAYADIFAKHDIGVVDTNYSKKIDFGIIKTARAIIKEKKIDIIYALNSRAISNAIFASLFSKAKLITYRGTTGGLYRYDPSSYLNALNPAVDIVLCVSHAVKKHVSKQLIFKKTEAIMIYKGHKKEWYKANKFDLSIIGTNSDNFNIAFVANVRPLKGLIYLLRAAKELSKIENIHIILIGTQISQEPYVSAIKESGMKERIHMTGYIDNAPDLISQCDVLVSTSLREGLSRVILEALASDTPVIASANESSLEIIEDGVNGYIVPIKDSQAIADKLKFLHSNPKTLKKLTNNASKVIETKFSHDETVRKYKKLFEDII